MNAIVPGTLVGADITDFDGFHSSIGTPNGDICGPAGAQMTVITVRHSCRFFEISPFGRQVWTVFQRFFKRGKDISGFCGQPLSLLERLAGPVNRPIHACPRTSFSR